MRIGLDGLPLTSQRTGVGHYTWELAVAVAKLAEESSFELLYPSTYPPIPPATGDAAPSNLKFTRVEVGPVGKHWWSTGLPRYLRKNKFELFHGTNYDVPMWRRCATVLTIHDLSLILFPETHRKSSVSRARRRLPLMVKTADAIITPSESVKQEVCEHLSVAPTKVFVVAEAARSSFHSVATAESEQIRNQLNCGEEFLLAVGTIEPRKNLTVLLDAFEQLVREPAHKDLRLVIAGGRGWLTNPFFEKLAGSAHRDRVVLTDYLHDDELRALYGCCRAFVYPSLYEGFGLPLLEAMACGAPVISSRIPALQETAGDAAGFFKPSDPRDLVSRIKEVLDTQTRDRMVHAGKERAAQFSWQKAAAATLKVYAIAIEQFSNRKK